MNTRAITGFLIAAIVISLIGYDVWAYFQHDEATISEWIWAQSKAFPLIPFGFGILMGHFFFRTNKD